MADNRRRTHANSIKRNRDFVKSKQFMEEDHYYLVNRLDMLKKSYALFIEEHNKLVTTLSGEKFDEQDNYFCAMEEMYQSITVKLNMRISELIELERLKKEVSAIKGSLNTNPTESTDSPASPGPEENIPLYLRENNETTGAKENFNVHANVRSEIHANEENHHSKRDLRFQIEKNRRQLQKVKENIGKYTKRVYCNNCGKNHQMHRCPLFRSMNTMERRERVRQLKLCANCFMYTERERDTHQCRFGKCRRCNTGEFHNSLLCLH